MNRRRRRSDARAMSGVVGPSFPLFIAVIAILGLIFGSFVGALSYRLPRGLSSAHGRSACTACGATLRARDLVPVFSWFAAKGACRYCGARVSWRYPAIEVSTLGLFVLAAIVVDDAWRLSVVLAMSPAMVALTAVDVEHQRLPNSLIAYVAVLALGFRWMVDADFLTACLAAIAVFAAALMLDLAGRRFFQQGLGMGDAKLMAVAALALPILPLLQALTCAGVLGVVSAFLWRAAKPPGIHFPFGPAILVSLWGALILL